MATDLPWHFLVAEFARLKILDLHSCCLFEEKVGREALGCTKVEILSHLILSGGSLQALPRPTVVAQNSQSFYPILAARQSS
jgi:hypothetical protein